MSILHGVVAALVAILATLAPAFAEGTPAPREAGARLQITKSEGGALLLSWDGHAANPEREATIYEGSLAKLRLGHWDLEPIDCSTGSDAREEVLPTPGSRYYLVESRPERRRLSVVRGNRTIERISKPTPCALRHKAR